MGKEIKRDVNYKRELVDYLTKNLAKGYSLDSLRWALVKQGHARIEIEKAIAVAKNNQSKKQTPDQQNNIKTESNPKIIVEPEQKISFWRRLFG